MGKICTFFGHRDSVITPEIKERIQATLIDLIEKENVDTFWFGAYGRFDADCTGIVRNLSNKYSHISMHLILPYPTKQGRKKGVFFEEEDFDSLSYFDPDKPTAKIWVPFFPASQTRYTILHTDTNTLLQG